MATRSLQITYVGDASKVLAAQRQIDAGHTKMQGGVAKTGGVFRSVYQTAMPFAAAAAGVAVVKLAQATIKAASDQGEALNKARVVFGQASQSVIAFSDDSASSFGISKAAALEAAAGFGAMVQSAGLTEKASAELSTELVGLAGDLASFNNQDPTEMLEKLRSGLAGEAEPLRRFGIFISEARVKAEAYAMGIATVGEELTDAQKIQARYNIILEDSAKAQGDFGRTLGESLPNQIRVLKAEFTDLAADIGQKLLPVLVDATSVLRSLIDLIQNPAPWDQARIAQERFGQAFATWTETAKTEAPEALHMVAQGAGGVSEEMQVMAQATEAGITDWEGLLEIFARGDVAMGDLVEAYKAQEAESENLALSIGILYGFTVDQTGATEDLAGASEDAADASREQRQAMLALSDSFLGILDSADQAAEAQRELNRLERQGKEDTKAYEQAVLDALEAQIGLEGAVVSYGIELAESGETTKDVRGKIKDLAAQFGLQDGVVQDLVQRVLSYIRALDDIPDQVTTNINAFWNPSNPGRPPELQSGGIVTRPTLAIVGEGGPEAVIPLNRARGIGATVVNVTVNGWVGNDQQIAARIRDELVRLQRLNAGTTGIR